MEEPPISRGASLSGDSNISIGGEIVIPLDDRLIDVMSRTSLGTLRTPPSKKAKRVRFFRNGDKFYTGVVMAVTPERYRSFDSLASDLTRALVSSVTLPNGVRSIYTMDGKKVQTVGDLEDGKCYVVSGQGELFKKVEYSASKVRRGSSLSGLPQSPAGTGRQISAIPACVKAKIVTLIRNGSKPRKIVRLLLNKRNSPSFEHVFEAITDAVKLDSGAVRRVYNLAGKPIISLEQFFESEEVFFAYGTEKSAPEDFELDYEETKCVQSFRRGQCVSKGNGERAPVMPKKSGKRTPSVPQVRTPSPSTLILPQPLRLHYAVGHVIGDGHFAVVRHCIHKTTGAEYAMKIVDKYKCQGKETMLASEVAILRQVCHPNIISLIGEQETDEQLFLVMELVKGGDLFDAIAAATKFSEPEASVMIGHLTSALAYLHSHHIVHRDVKPENLLVEMEGSRVRCLKLGDFGLAQIVREPLYTVCGTPTYVAPEILAENGYGLKIDVWAAGVILYILLCGFPPFVSADNDQEEQFERILSGQYEFTSPYWDPVSYSAKQLISNMLQAQPELRFSAEDVLDHPWLVSFLGGEQTVSGGGTVGESSKQHRNQQCQPLRLATFEFDYKKQRRVDVSSDSPAGDANNLGTSTADVKSQWLDASVSVNEAFRKSTIRDSSNEVHHDEGSSSRDELDHINGNKNSDEPLSLSADCLRNIRDFTSSVHDLVNNIEDTRDGCEVINENKSKKASSHKNAASSNSSISENSKSTRMRNKNSERSRDSSRSESPIASKVHSVNTKNGNSLKDIHSSLVMTPGRVANNRRYDTPKNCKYDISTRVIRPKPTNLSKASAFTASRNSSNDSSCEDQHWPVRARCQGEARASPIKRHGYLQTETRRRSCNERNSPTNSLLDRLSHSTDGCSGSSDNNIETSDSFVNIKFAKQSNRQRRASSSTQSIESSDSFENTRFERYPDTLDAEKLNEDLCLGVIEQSPISSRIPEVVDKRKTHVAPNRQIRPVNDLAASRNSRPSLIPVQNNGHSKNLVKPIETSRIPLSESVKMREKKTPNPVSNQFKNDPKTKRFSCFPQYSTKLNAKNETGEKSSHASIENGRKCSSTDELREEQQKQQSTAKTKRFSLYYTPQPSRKNYDTENKSARNTSKTPGTLVSSSSRPTSWRTPETTKGVIEQNYSSKDRRDVTKNRKSIAESSTVASRSKANRQSMHIRPNPSTSTINTNLTPGRTK